MATYRIQAPNGQTYRLEGPDGASQEDLVNALMAQHPEAGQPVPETTFGGNVKEFFKGIVPGAVGMAQSAATGAAALLSDEQEKVVRGAVDTAAEAARRPFQAAPGYEDALGRKIGEGVGSFGSMAALAPFGAPGVAAAAALATGAGAGEARVRAEKEGATGDQRATATGFGAVIGASELLPIFKFLDTLSTPIKAGILNAVRRAAVTGGAEAAQEVAAQAAQNLVAQGVYKPDQAIMEGAGEAATVGGAVGALVQGITDMALGRRTASIQRDEDDKRRRDAILAAQEKGGGEAPDFDMATALPRAKELQAQLNALRLEKVAKPADEIEKARNKQIDEEIKALVGELRPIAQFIAKNRKEMTQGAVGVGVASPEDEARYAALEAAAARDQGTADKPVDTARAEGVIPQRDLFGQEALGATSDKPVEVPDAAEVAERRTGLERQATLLQQTASEREVQAFEAAQAGDIETARAALAEVQRLETAVQAAQKQIKELPAAPTPTKPKADPLLAVTKAGEMGDRAALIRALSKVTDTPQAAASPQEQGDLFGKENVQQTEERNARLQPKQNTAYDRADLLSGPRDNSDLMAALRPLQEQQNAERDVQEKKVRPEAEALQRIGQREVAPSRVEPALARRQTEEALVGTLVGTLPRTPETTPAGQINRGVSQTPAVDREALLADLEVARATRNREEVSRIVQALKDLKRPTDSQSIRDRMRAALVDGNRPLARQLFQDLQQARADEAGQQPNAGPADLAKAMGSTLPEGFAESRAGARAASATTNAFAQLVRAHRALGAARDAKTVLGSYTRVKLEEALAQAQAAFLARVSDEVAARGGDVDAQLKAVSKAEEMVALLKRIWDKNPRYALDEVRRAIDAAVAPQQPQRAEQRRKEPGPARVGAPDELTLADSPRESRDPVKAARDAVARLTGTPGREVAAERVERTTPPQRGKSMQDLGAIMAQPTERLVSETQPADKDDLALLQEAADLLTPTGTEFAALVREQAERYAQGRPVDRKDLQDAIAEQRQGRQSDGAQREMFPRSEVTTERATPENFQKYLDSKEVTAFKAQLAKEAAANRKAAQKADSASRSEEQVLEEADRVLTQKRKRAQERIGFAERWKQDLTQRLGDLDDTIDRFSGYRDDLQTRLDAALARDLDTTLGGYDMAAQEALDAWKQRQSELLRPLVDALGGRIERVTGKRDAVLQELDADAVMLQDYEGFAGMALKDVNRAQKSRDAALRAVNQKEAADDRQYEGRLDARRAAANAYAQSIQRAREGLGLPGTRVTRDTTASAAEKQAVGLKRAIGSLTEQLADAHRAGDDKKVNEIIGRRENALAKLAGVFEMAPKVRKELNNADEEAAFAEYEAAQRAFEVAEAKRRLGQNEGAPALGPRRKGALTRGQTSEPRSLRTASPESVRGENVTNVGSRPEQAGKLPPVDRNSGDYQAEANRIADEIRGKGVDPAAAAKRAAEAEAKEARRLARENRPARDDKVPDVDDDALFMSAQQAASDTLSDTAVEALEADNLSAALNNIAQTSKSKLNRAVAQRLKALLGGTSVRLDATLKNDKGEPVYGASSRDGTVIWLNPETGLNEETLLHEAVHAATERMLQAPESSLSPEQLAAKRELVALFQTAKADPKVTSVDAKDNISEFVAEALSNPVLQDQLRAKPWKLRSAWDGFKRTLLKLLGVTTPPTDMLDATLTAAETLFAAPRREGTATPAAFQAKRESIIASPRSIKDRVKANLGLAFRTQFVDALAPMEALARNIQDSARATQMMYYGRMFGQRMSLVSQAASRGPLSLVKKTRKDGRVEHLIESQQGASLKDVAAEIKASGITNSDRADQLFSLYLVDKRASRVGWDKLNFSDPGAAKAEVKAALAEIASTPGAEAAFKRAAGIYNAYNKGMLRFLVDTDALSEEQYKKLTATNDYVPFYRQRNGNAELVIGTETPIRIGNLKDSPHLQELVGGDDKILPFSASAVQNTSLLTDMALRNIASKNLAMELAMMHMGHNAEKKPQSPIAHTNVFEYRDKGIERYAVVDTDALGIPADLLVKGLAGIPTMLPAGLTLLSAPSRLLRKAITVSPVYAARQLFRDSTAAAISSGANITPVVSALKQLGKASPTKEALESRGITGGAVFTGTSEDMSKVMRDMMAGGNVAMRALGALEAMTMEADASTRRAQYNSYIKQGLSEMEATLMSLESMNFTRRGLSPTLHAVAQLVPFFNAQIQGLDVLWRTMKGDMPMNEQLDIRRKFYTRGMFLAATTLAYVMAMQDDEAYKNATPEERAMNFFVRVPGFDEPIRIPVPFEIGYIFKSLPEAALNGLSGAQDSKKTWEAVNRILINTIPGGSSLLSVDVNGVIVPTPIIVPAAAKPIVEAMTGTSLFTRRPIESTAEQAQLPGYRFRENTSETAKLLGEMTGVSPIMIENTVRGYTSSIGMALLQSLNGLYPDDGPEQASKRLSQMPVFGPLFQPNTGRQAMDVAYAHIKEIEQKKATFESLVDRGERAKAMAFLQENANEMAYAAVAGNAKQQLGQVAKMIRAVQASDMGADEKLRVTEELKRVLIQMSETFSAALEKR